MHDCADLADRLVNGCERRIDERLDGGRIGLARCNFLLRGVQGHTGREELLDREIVQVTSNAVTLVEQRSHVLRVTSGG